MFNIEYIYTIGEIGLGLEKHIRVEAFLGNSIII